MTTKWATTAASASTSERPTSGTATFAMSSTLSVSNKPMVPTAHAWPADNSIDPMRRHMGKPLGSQRGDEQRPAKEQDLGRGQRTASSDRRDEFDPRRTATKPNRSGEQRRRSSQRFWACPTSQWCGPPTVSWKAVSGDRCSPCLVLVDPQEYSAGSRKLMPLTGISARETVQTVLS